MGFPRLGQTGGGFVMFDRHARDLLVGERQARRGGGGLVAQRDQGGPCAFQPLLGFPPRLPGLLFGGIGRSCVDFRRRACFPCPGGFGFGGCQLRAQIGQPVALTQPYGRGRRGSGHDRVAIPSPDRAGAGHQHLSRR